MAHESDRRAGSPIPAQADPGKADREAIVEILTGKDAVK